MLCSLVLHLEVAKCSSLAPASLPALELCLGTSRTAKHWGFQRLQPSCNKRHAIFVSTVVEVESEAWPPMPQAKANHSCYVASQHLLDSLNTDLCWNILGPRLCLSTISSCWLKPKQKHKPKMQKHRQHCGG